MSRQVFLIVSTFFCVASPAIAQVDAPLISAVPRCLDIQQRADRLTCFERAAHAIRAALSRTSTVHPAEEAANSAEFGLPRRQRASTRQQETAKVHKTEPARELSAIIASVAPAGNGYRLRLDDGSEWNVSSSSLGRAPARGDRIIIETGVLSGYRATIPGKAGLLRVRRIR